MNSLLQQHVEQYFSQELGMTLDALLVPVNAHHPAGNSLRNTTVYSAIKKARSQDDPSLPLGAWEHELKRADWSQVSTLAVNGLQQSKDMQLVAWLLEAQIHLKGFAGIAPCLILMQRLCVGFWEHIYPVKDLEFRSNIIRWIAEKLLPALNLVPLVDDGDKGSYNWSHWEQAQRNEQLKVNANSRHPVPHEGVGLQELTARIVLTPSEHFQVLQQHLVESLEAIIELSQTLDELCGDAAPSMSNMMNLLLQIQSFVDVELHKRGVRLFAVPKEAASTDEGVESDKNALNKDTSQLLTPVTNAARTRAEAYATLAATAEFLIQLEPHSPVPYLVKRATEWGSLNTVELYQELFLRLNGQLNIFEMLGLQGGAVAHE